MLKICFILLRTTIWFCLVLNFCVYVLLNVNLCIVLYFRLCLVTNEGREEKRNE